MRRQGIHPESGLRIALSFLALAALKGASAHHISQRSNKRRIKWATFRQALEMRLLTVSHLRVLGTTLWAAQVGGALAEPPTAFQCWKLNPTDYFLRVKYISPGHPRLCLLIYEHVSKYLSQLSLSLELVTWINSFHKDTDVQWLKWLRSHEAARGSLSALCSHPAKPSSTQGLNSSRLKRLRIPSFESRLLRAVQGILHSLCASSSFSEK